MLITRVFQDSSRAGFLPSRGSKKPPSERDMYMNLWKNYVVMGCCMAPPVTKHDHQRSVSPDPRLGLKSLRIKGFKDCN